LKDIALDFRLRKDAQRGVFVVQMVDPAWEVGGDLAFDFGNQRLTRVLERIERDQCTLDDLREIGVNLWAGLMTGEVGERFEALRREIELEAGGREPVRFQLRLTLPPELDALPWESLYHEKDFGFIACHPDHCVLRSPPASINPPALPSPHGGKLKILAVIPSGSGLNAEHEWHNLELAVSQLRHRVDLERLSGRVDADRLGERLRTQRYDVVHFIGHGEQTSEGKSFVRLNSDEPGGETRWIEGEQFGNLFFNSGVRLAVLNCCLGAKPSPLRSMSGLGPFLLRAGIPAVIAMRYEIADAVAIRFADKLYRELLNGLLPGRIDLAVEHARRSIYQTQDESDVRAFVTPILFLSPGCEQLFEIESPPDPPPPKRFRAPSDVALPEELLDALRQGLCVPIIGPRVLTAGGVRSGGPQVTEPRELAAQLAAKFSYPRQQDLDLCEIAGDWMDLTVLQWICQFHTTQTRGASYKLTQAVQNTYKDSQPPALLSLIADWNAPGMFYLYFDGLLEEAFEQNKKPIRVVNAVDAPVPPGDEPLLVHVRGTHKRADSLILTEQDHDKLWDRIGRMTPEIAELVRGHIGRSPLFLGIHPRDPLVKRLISKLLEQASRNTLGPVFFLCRPGEKGDSYWEEFPVVWVEGDLENLILAVTQAVSREN
jgi:CHAT domain/SIR2-like domain